MLPFVLSEPKRHALGMERLKEEIRVQKKENATFLLKSSLSI
jgi:hypothetical protein